MIHRAEDIRFKIHEVCSSDVWFEMYLYDNGQEVRKIQILTNDKLTMRDVDEAMIRYLKQRKYQIMEKVILREVEVND